MFLGRERELKELTEKLSNSKFEAILLYGRRRIGKTELIRRAAQSFEGLFLYYECKRSLYGDNISGLNELLKKSFNYSFSFENFRDILQFILDQSAKTPILFALDELPFLITENSNVVSDIRDLIDEYNQKTNCKIVFSGSYVDVMKSLIEGNRETFGRFTGIIELKAFDYYDSAKFYSNYTNEEKILMYSVFGGVAFFNSLIDASLSPTENIYKLLLSPNSILQLEIEHTISSETNKIPMLNSLIEEIGKGSSKYSDINNKLTTKRSRAVNIDYLLKKLSDMEIVEKKVPINDKENRKKITYCFSDNLMQFYYQYIYRNKNMNSIMDVHDFYTEFVEDDLKTRYLPKKFEKISQEYLIRASRQHLISPVIYEIGTYSFDDQQCQES